MEVIIGYTSLICALIIRFVKSKDRWPLVGVILTFSGIFLVSSYLSLQQMAEWIQEGDEVKFYNPPNPEDWPDLPYDCRKSDSYLFVRKNHDGSITKRCTPSYLGWNLAWWHAKEW